MSHALKIDDAGQAYAYRAAQTSNASNNDSSQGSSFADILKALRELMVLFISTCYSMNTINKDQIKDQYDFDLSAAKASGESMISQAIGEGIAAVLAIAGAAVAIGVGVDAMGQMGSASTDMKALNSKPVDTEAQAAQVNNGAVGVALEAPQTTTSVVDSVAQQTQSTAAIRKNVETISAADKANQMKEINNRFKKASGLGNFIGQPVSQMGTQLGILQKSTYDNAAGLEKTAEGNARAASGAISSNKQSTEQIVNATSGTLDSIGKQTVKGVLDTIQSTANGIR